MTSQETPDNTTGVLTRAELRALFHQLAGRDWLLAALLYGSGLRLWEAVRLRVQDLDLERGLLHIRHHPGRGNRQLRLDPQLIPHLRIHLAHVRQQHLQDLNRGGGAVPRAAPGGTGVAYTRRWHQQYVFPDARESHAARGRLRRRHVSESTVEQALRRGLQRAGVRTPATSHSLRRCFALHLLEQGHSLTTVRYLLGHTPESAPGTGFKPVESPLRSLMGVRTLAQQLHSRRGRHSVEEPQALYLIAS
ncbi:MAG: tyrosine-type recombinase/integrase [Pseudomonadota bacterium]|nr:tyrosine-type recombinase/integrase [Pseudomonadota bacterium]